MSNMISDSRNSVEVEANFLSKLNKSTNKNELNQLVEIFEKATLEKTYSSPRQTLMTHTSLSVLPGETLHSSKRKKIKPSLKKMSDNASKATSSLAKVATPKEQIKAQSKSSSFIRNLSLKFKTSTKLRRHTTSLSEVGKLFSSKKANANEESVFDDASFSLENQIPASCVFLEQDNKLLNDCSHFSSRCLRKHVDNDDSETALGKDNENFETKPNFS